MFGRRVTLFKLFGFAIHIDASWLLIAAFWTWSFAVGVFPNTYSGLSRSSYWWMAVAATLGLFASIVVHELFHSLVARRYDLKMNGITLFLFGGVAEMAGEPEKPKTEFLMAIAGPIASVVIGFVFHFIAVAAAGAWPVAVVGVIAYLSWLNWVLAAFNMVPAFPLDGGRVLRAALWHFQGDVRRATRIASGIGSGFGFLLMFFGLYRLLVGDFISAVWYFLIGMFLRGASQMSYEQVLMRTVLSGEPVSRFMHSDPVRVRAGTSIRDLVENYIYRYHFKMFPVVSDNDQLIGCVSTRDVKEVSNEEWSRRTVDDIVKRCSDENTVSPDTDALKVLNKMRQTGAGRLLVADHGRLLAVVSVKDLLNFLGAKLDLEGLSSPHAVRH
jgi:Zn-dependent protease/CBS domain-containing protein